MRIGRASMERPEDNRHRLPSLGRRALSAVGAAGVTIQTLLAHSYDRDDAGVFIGRMIYLDAHSY